MKQILFLQVILFSVLSSNLNGQSDRISKIDNLLTDLTKRDLFSGAVIIAENWQILLSKGYGYSNREQKTPNTPDTRFDLSSGSKVFTGTAVTLLAQQGKIKLSDPVGKYIEGLPLGN